MAKIKWIQTLHWKIYLKKKLKAISQTQKEEKVRIYSETLFKSKKKRRIFQDIKTVKNVKLNFKYLYDMLSFIHFERKKL